MRRTPPPAGDFDELLRNVNKPAYFRRFPRARAPIADAPETPAPAPLVRILPAEAYNTIKGIAASCGGIGFGLEFENDADFKGMIPVDRRERGQPLTPHAMLVVGSFTGKEATAILHNAGLFDQEATNFAPRRIIERERIPFGTRAGDPWPRFSFASWCAELNIQKGE